MKNLFISGGCNSVYNGLDFCQYEPNTNIVAFPCSNQVLVYDVDKIKILYSFSVFQKRVNCVRFLNQNTLIAADGEGKIAIFNESQLLHQLKTSDSIQIFKIIENYIITLSIDGNVSVYDHELKFLSKLSFGHNVMECVDAIVFDKTIFVSLSGVDTQIHLYTIQDNQLQYRTSVKGHQRSVNSLQFYVKNEHTLLLASASKDTYVRIWSIYHTEQIEAKIKHLKIDQQLYSFKLETILQSHNEEVSSISWFSSDMIVSGSFDYNAIIWKVDKETGLWLSVSRLGQTNGNKNQIFGLQLSKDKQSIVCYTLTGAIFVWKLDKNNNWAEQSAITGHYAEVTDLDFNDYLITCSIDQTSRIFSKWNENCTYHEISRPQVHGYDLHAIKQLNNQIISGGDEKILRMFNASPFTINQLNYLSHQNIDQSVFLKQVPSQIVTYNNRTFNEYKLAAENFQQALGLMNVQMQYEDEEFENVKQDDEVVNLEIKYGIPPNDSLLVNKSLWPETNKLYGHAYAIQSISTFKDIAASSSVAITAKAAEIIIWDTNNFKIKQSLPCHNYTVVQLQFSKSGKYLLSVSKDRCLGVFEQQEDESYKLLSKSQPCSRIVYTCAFNHDESLIFTGSRDKKLRIYKTKEAFQPIKDYEFPKEITAIDAIYYQEKQLIAVGYGQGNLEVYELTSDLELKLISTANEYNRHSKQINRLKFNNNLLASCSDDHTVRIYEI